MFSRRLRTRARPEPAMPRKIGKRDGTQADNECVWTVHVMWPRLRLLGAQWVTSPQDSRDNFCKAQCFGPALSPQRPEAAAAACGQSRSVIDEEKGHNESLGARKGSEHASNSFSCRQRLRPPRANARPGQKARSTWMAPTSSYRAARLLPASNVWASAAGSSPSAAPSRVLLARVSSRPKGNVAGGALKPYWVARVRP